MNLFDHTSPQSILFLMLYAVTGVVPLMEALYLLLRRGNAIAPDITPPVRLRRWAAAFFALSALDHVLWLFFYLYVCHSHSFSEVVHSVGYAAIVVFDCVTLLSTLAGTLLAMLQDRRRPVWPVFAAMIPFVVLAGVYVVQSRLPVILMAIAYVLLLYVLFTVYMVFAVRQYGRWLNDNYADLENKKVWLSQVVTLGCLLLFFLYTLAGINSTPLMFLLHFTELVLFGLLLWRVETLPLLESEPATEALPLSGGMPAEEVPDGSATTPDDQAPALLPPADPISIDVDQMEQLLKEHCVATQLYLQDNLTLQMLAQAVGTNRSYLSQYFSRQGITYNIYINNQRINHFVSRCRDLSAAGQDIPIQQLALESGFRSYRTFSRAFLLRTGQSVTEWLNGGG